MNLFARSNRLSGDRAFNFLNTAFLIMMLIAVSYPILYVVSSSFSAPKAIMTGKVWLLPVQATLEGYQTAFRYSRLINGFSNSFFYAIAGTALNISISIMAAYPLSRKDLLGRNLLMFVFAFTMWFSGGLIPTYILIKDLGLYNTRWVMLIPQAMSVYNMILVRTYFANNIPGELHEASRIDGCDDFRFIRSVVIPLSGPIIAVIGLFYAVSHWNAFFTAFIYLSNRQLHPLQIVLREILIMNQANDMLDGSNIADAETRMYLYELLKYTTIVIASLPIILIYPFIQKFFTKGIMIGAIKG
jgi:putative aldouronate transport system permease protein